MYRRDCDRQNQGRSESKKGFEMTKTTWLLLLTTVTIIGLIGWRKVKRATDIDYIDWDGV
jgi:hypothetical protein